MLEFKPVKIKEMSSELYPDTQVPKLTEKQVEYAQREFLKFLKKIASHGMKFDYDHMNGGFYVRDFRLDWPSSCNSQADNDTKSLFWDIVSDGNIDICSGPRKSQDLPCFANENEGFHVWNGATPTMTLPY